MRGVRLKKGENLGRRKKMIYVEEKKGFRLKKGEGLD